MANTKSRSRRLWILLAQVFLVVIVIGFMRLQWSQQGSPASVPPASVGQSQGEGRQYICGVRSGNPTDAKDTITEEQRTATYYPPNRGLVGVAATETLRPGAMIDRFGTDAGRFVAPAGTPVPMRSLPSGAAEGPYGVFRVAKPIVVQSGTTAPWFGQLGGGTQYELPQSIQCLLRSGHLERAGP